MISKRSYQVEHSILSVFDVHLVLDLHCPFSTLYIIVSFNIMMYFTWEKLVTLHEMRVDRRIFVNPIPDEPRINKITPGHSTSQLLSTCGERTLVSRTPTITVRLLNSRKTDHTTAATADTGACATILGTNLFHEMGMTFKELTDRGTDTPSAANGFRLQSIGRTALDLDHDGTTLKVLFCRHG